MSFCISDSCVVLLYVQPDELEIMQPTVTEQQASTTVFCSVNYINLEVLLPFAFVAAPGLCLQREAAFNLSSVPLLTMGALFSAEVLQLGRLGGERKSAGN